MDIHIVLSPQSSSVLPKALPFCPSALNPDSFAVLCKGGGIEEEEEGGGESRQGRGEVEKGQEGRKGGGLRRGREGEEEKRGRRREGEKERR